MKPSEVLVTGGTGTLGLRVVERLRFEGREVRVMSRGGQPGTVKGDLLTGEGVEEAVRGVDTIVHCASGHRKTRQTDVEGTEFLLRKAAQAGVSHVVFISIVGVDRNPFFYYRIKLATENVVERSPVPWTILRSTQFHDLMLKIVGALSRVPFAAPIPKSFLFQPIDAGEVADRLVEQGLSGPAGRVPDVGGSQARTLANLARSYLVKPWLKKQWCIPELSAEFVWRMEDVLDLYEEPYDPNKPVLCFEELPYQIGGRET